MKKKLLFINPSIGIGGAEKSLQTLLSLLDYDKYDVDLIMFRPEGALLDLLPPQVRLLDVPEIAKVFCKPMKEACIGLLKQGKFGKLLTRIRFFNVIRKEEAPRKKVQYSWKYLKKVYETLPTEYDVAIAYLEGTPIYFCADMVKAKKKIGYIHNDYKKLDMDDAFDNAYFNAFDYLVTVSKECAASLRDSFPAHKDKVRVVENILAPEAILRRAEEEADFGDDFQGLRLLTMGRFEPQKGYDLAIEACKQLADKVDFRWYALGDGTLENEIKAQIQSAGLQDRFILLGTRLNPYPYIRACDIYVQPSRFEGKSIALEEAKALHKPILTTAFSTVADQITDGVTGSVAEINADSIAEKLLELMKNPALREKYTENLQSYTGNVSELEKFYSLVE